MIQDLLVGALALFLLVVWVAVCLLITFIIVVHYGFFFGVVAFVLAMTLTFKIITYS